MKSYYLLTCSVTLLLASCGMNKTSTGSNNEKSDTAAVSAIPDSTSQKSLVAKLQTQSTFKKGDSVLLRFTVYNPTDSSMKFCKWHTPFEPLMSKYLDVKDESGQEAPYQGAMAKRIMPPPESSYLTVKPKDSMVVSVDLLKGYLITKPGKYTVTYVGGNMSGLVANNSVSFDYK